MRACVMRLRTYILGLFLNVINNLSISVSRYTGTHTMELNKSNVPFQIQFSLRMAKDERNMSDVLWEWPQSC
jgi:hypothetical protein